MARFHGIVGFGIPEDDQVTGIATERMAEKRYYGKILSHIRNWAETDGINADLKLQNRIAITANDYALSHLSALRYVIWQGTAWTISSVEVKGPEIILSIGGVWHGRTAQPAE